MKKKTSKKGEKMGIKKFFNDIVDFLDLDDFSVKGKKKTMKDLLSKLEKRRKDVKAKLEKIDSKKDKKNLEEALKLIDAQIKKGKKHLAKLEHK